MFAIPNFPTLLSGPLQTHLRRFRHLIRPVIGKTMLLSGGIALGRSCLLSRWGNRANQSVSQITYESCADVLFA